MKNIIDNSRRYAEYQKKKIKENKKLPDSWFINTEEIYCNLFKKNKNECLNCENKYNITFCLGA